MACTRLFFIVFEEHDPLYLPIINKKNMPHGVHPSCDLYAYSQGHSLLSSQIRERDAVKETLQQLLPKFKKRVNKELEERHNLLSDNPGLLQLYKDLVSERVFQLAVPTSHCRPRTASSPSNWTCFPSRLSDLKRNLLYRLADRRF